MFTITFNKSKSKYYQKALNHAMNLGGKMVEEEVRLEFPISDLLFLYPKLEPLLGIIQSWSSTRATYKGRRVHPYRFIFQIWHDIRQCSLQRRDGPDDRHCWQTNDLPGWGCRKITKLLRYNTGAGDYVKSTRYWYNYGEFDDTGLWLINKRMIYDVLMKQVGEKAIDSCPYFDHRRLWETIQDLPEIIRVDNSNYELHYIREYEDGRKVLKPVNIRHKDPLIIDRARQYKPQLGTGFSRN